MMRRFHEDRRRSGQSAYLYRVGDLTILVGQRRAVLRDAEVELSKRTFDLLVALVEASPNALSIDDLIEKVWQGSVVSAATVAKRIELLRSALEDDSKNPRYIALVRGHGYRLIPAISKEATESPGLMSTARPWLLGGTLTIFLVVLLVVAFRGSPPPDKSLVVLPFKSMSGSAEDQNFADGLTEELSHVLARMGDLKVTGRTSSFYYKDRDEDLREIGEALGVSYLLEGSVRRSGDKLRIAAQLIAAEDGFHLWSEAYDRELADILTIQEDIAQNVALKLRISLLDSGNPVTDVDRLQDPEAYALYLKARSLSTWGEVDGLAQAQAYIEEALSRDPGFAPSWNRLAAIHGRRLFYRDPSYEFSLPEGLNIVRSAVDKALAIDPESAEAFANLGGVAWVFEGDATKAAPLIERALELDISSLEIIQFACDFAKYIGRLEEALPLEESLVERDPLCIGCRLGLARSYTYTGRLDEAEQQIRTLQLIETGGFLWSLGTVLLMKGQASEALAVFDEIDPADHQSMQGRAMALYDLGRLDESNAALELLAAMWGDTRPVLVAKAFAYVGRTDAAFSWLNSAVPFQQAVLQTDYPDPMFDNLRNDERWPQLMHRIGRTADQTARIPFELPKLDNSAAGTQL